MFAPSSPVLTCEFSSEFGLAFIEAKQRCNARSRHSTFDASVLEIEQEDLKLFLETLCEVGEGY